MEIQKAKIAKANAQDKILRIIEDLEDETHMTIADVRYSSELVSVVMGRSARYMKKVKLILEL